MLTLRKDELFEVFEDGALQGVFPWDHSFNYDCKVPKGEMYRIRIDLPGNDLEGKRRDYFYTDEVKETKEGFYINDEYLPKDKTSVCKCLMCTDINGKLLYEKDFVKTDEMDWCGFAMLEKGPDEIFGIKNPVCVLGKGGFSYLPSLLEWIASPIFGEYRKQNDKEYLMRVEKDFMKENDVRII